MKQLDISCIKRWVAKGSSKLSQPASIGINCPECSLRGVFSTKRRYYDEYRDTLSCSADCPACNVQVHFWIKDLIGQSDKGDDHQPSLYMSPASTPHLDLSELPEIVPANLVQFCASTQDVYQTGNLTATSVLVQSTLDALFTEFLPRGNSHPNLAKLITDSIPSIELEKPLKQLAESFRPEGNLRALLDCGQHTSQETAEALMKLLECLIQYIYVMPEEFSKLEVQFAELNRVTNLARRELDSASNTPDSSARDNDQQHDEREAQRPAAAG